MSIISWGIFDEVKSLAGVENLDISFNVLGEFGNVDLAKCVKGVWRIGWTRVDIVEEMICKDISYIMDLDKFTQ